MFVVGNNICRKICYNEGGGRDLAGQVYHMRQKIISQKSRGNQIIASSIKTKMILKGIAVDKYTPASPDDPVVIQKVKDIAKEFGLIV